MATGASVDVVGTDTGASVTDAGATGAAVDRSKLNLENRSRVLSFLKRKKIDAVIHCAAYVGGIKANNVYKADFIAKNLQIQNNIIIGSFESGIKKLIFLGSR